MAARQLIETDVNLMLASIQANIADALAEVSDARERKVSSLKSPQAYFFYDNVRADRLPAIFVVPTVTDFRLQRGQNFIDSTNLINVTVVIEDRLVQDLTVCAWRYQAALHKIIHGVPLETADGSVKIVPKVTRNEFSPVYSNAQKAGDPQGAFRMEVLLLCEVEHYESLT